MISRQNIRSGWRLLNGAERRRAAWVLAVVVVAALSAAAMVFSVMPFFSALSDPDYIHRQSSLAWLYNGLGFSSELHFILFLGVASIITIVVANALQFLRIYSTAHFTRMQMHNISSRLLGAYLRQPYEFFLELNASKASAYVLSESAQVVNSFFTPMVELVAAFAVSFAILSMLIWIEPQVSLVAFSLIGGTYSLVLILLRKPLARLGQQRLETMRARFVSANDALTGIKDIKILGREGSYLEHYAFHSKGFAKAQAIIIILGSVPQFLIQIIAFGGIILLCLLLVDSEGLARGDALSEIIPLLGVFAVAGQRLIPEMQRIYGSLVQLRTVGPILEALDAEFVGARGKRPFGDPDARPMELKHSLKFDEVSYRYPGSEVGGLNDMSFEIGAGMSLGIVGRSGAGKTTLADLILGLLRPSRGQIVVDGTPVTEDNLEAWQRTVGYVPQAVFLQDASIAENIALGVPLEQRDDERVRRAAAAAQLDEFIATSLPQGYATPVGDRGVRLSGGQKQRVGIARALYRDAEVMVFDEATSALDSVTEKDLMKAISLLADQKTIIIIAHRLSTVRDCDRIAVFEHGRLVGFGTWDELQRANPVFAQMALEAEDA